MFERLRKVIEARIGEDEEGFTLVELLIVIVVLGILAAVTVFGLSGSASQSAVSACKADARTVEVAVDAWHSADRDGNWPAAIDPDLTKPSTLPAPNTHANDQPYLRAVPTSTHYTISLKAGGAVWVTPANGATAKSFDDTSGVNVCETVK